MPIAPFARRVLTQEARALLTRLDRVRPLVLIMPMVSAATVSPEAQRAVEGFLFGVRRDLRRRVAEFLAWLGETGSGTSAARVQRRFSFLKLKFNAVLTQFDIFADVLTQRSEHGYGVWLAGLDVAAEDGLRLPGSLFRAPPVMTYLDRGHGAAIRRARTRLPGGGDNPVAIVRVPRERMVGSGIASSLIHEVGHQGAALLDLVRSLREELRGRQARAVREEAQAWELWGRWISEIVADFWSVAKLGVTSTQGLIGVVSLPRAFVFRIQLDDPHPFPWIRVKLSCAVGRRLYPDPQWQRLDRMWESFYPLDGLDPERRNIVERLEATMPELVDRLVEHRPAALAGRALGATVGHPSRRPARLRAHFDRWRGRRGAMRRTPPTLAFAVLGQAKLDGRISPRTESRTLSRLLALWALQRTLGTPVPAIPAGLQGSDSKLEVFASRHTTSARTSALSNV